MPAIRTLCAGDRFITGDALADAARHAFEADTSTVSTDWPDIPFGPVEGVREASGDPARLAQAINAADAEVVLTHLAPVTASVFSAARSVRVVGVTRGGPVNVDLDAATRAGVPVIFLPGRNLGAVAEFTIGVMISLPRGIAAASATLHAGTWDASYFRYERTGPELRAATIGLVGLGAVGMRVAELAGAFGARVLGYDPFADEAAVRAGGIEPVSLAELLAGSDIVSVHARLNDDTRRMFGASAFEAMKPGAYFVNTARGELVDQSALVHALQSGHLAGAALDVFDPEPPEPHDRLLTLPNVVITPHLAGSSRQVATESCDRVANEVGAFLAGRGIVNCANPQWRDHQRRDHERGADERS